MAVDVGVAVPGEVLDRRGHARVSLEAGHLGRGQRRGEPGVRAERAHPDDGVGGVAVDVRDRRQVLVDAHRAQVLAGHPRSLASEPRVTCGAQRHGAREANRRRSQPLDDAVFLVSGDQDGHRAGIERGTLDAVR